MTILAIDSSNDTLGIALYQNKKIIAEYTSISAQKHSIRLMPAIVQLLENANVLPKDLGKIVVAKGPGSYTGVRIGLSVAKGLSWSLNIPIVGISSLEALSQQAKGRDQLVCPFFDARRGLVYTGLYDEHGKSVIEDQNILMSDWLDQIAKMNKPILFISPDVDKHRTIIEEKLNKNALFIPEGFEQTRPGLLALIGKDREGDDVHQLVPSYLRMVEAEVNWLKDQKGK